MSTALPIRPRKLEKSINLVIVRSKYNEKFTTPLLENCIDELSSVLPKAKITLLDAPGSFEVPVTVAHALNTINPDAVIALGLIIKGGTQHADLIAQSITQALQNLAVTHVKPIMHEVLLVNDEDQAYARCIGSDLNRGREAARAVCEILTTFSSQPKPLAEKKAPF